MLSPLELGCVYLKGAYLPPSEARVSPFDFGFLYGDGVFETLRTYGGVPFRLERHLDRLFSALNELRISAVPPPDVLAGIVEEVLRRSGLDEAYLRLTVTRGVGSRGLDPEATGEPTVMVAALPLRGPAPHLYRDGVRLVTLWPRDRRDRPSPWIKSSSFQRAVLARFELKRLGADEGLYLDGEGRVTEATVANVFAVRDGRLYTPPEDSCLRGITRAEVLDLAAEQDIPLEEVQWTPAEYQAANELFLTGSLAELLPVSHLDGAPIGTGQPGPMWHRLHQAYQARTRAGLT